MTQDASPNGGGPPRAGLVLVSLILVAAVANLNLSVANVALPSIGAHFDSSQTTLDMIAVGYSLGLACSVLWLGALGDRYGRKMMLVWGTALAIPMSLLAALAPTDSVLALARIGGGIAAGMAFPTTLALITALWAPGAKRTVDCALVGPRRSDRGARTPPRGAAPRALLLGIGLLPDAAAGRRRDLHGRALRARARERGERARGQPRRDPLARSSWAP